MLFLEIEDFDDNFVMTILLLFVFMIRTQLSVTSKHFFKIF